MDQPLRKMSCFSLFRPLIFWSKNQAFVSEISKNDLTCFSQKNRWEKVWCLVRNLELSPLDNVDVFHFWKLFFLCSKNLSFLTRRSKKLYFWPDLYKNTNKKSSIFGQKRWIYPLRKISIFWQFLKR